MRTTDSSPDKWPRGFTTRRRRVRLARHDLDYHGSVQLHRTTIMTDNDEVCMQWCLLPKPFWAGVGSVAEAFTCQVAGVCTRVEVSTQRRPRAYRAEGPVFRPALTSASSSSSVGRAGSSALWTCTEPVALMRHARRSPGRSRSAARISAGTVVTQRVERVVVEGIGERDGGFPRGEQLYAERRRWSPTS